MDYLKKEQAGQVEEAARSQASSFRDGDGAASLYWNVKLEIPRGDCFLVG